MKFASMLFVSVCFVIATNAFGYCASCGNSYSSTYTYTPDIGTYAYSSPNNNYYDNYSTGPTYSPYYSSGGCNGGNCGNYSGTGCCNAYNNGNYNGRCTGNCLDEDY